MGKPNTGTDDQAAELPEFMVIRELEKAAGVTIHKYAANDYKVFTHPEIPGIGADNGEVSGEKSYGSFIEVIDACVGVDREYGTGVCCKGWRDLVAAHAKLELVEIDKGELGFVIFLDIGCEIIFGWGERGVYPMGCTVNSSEGNMLDEFSDVHPKKKEATAKEEAAWISKKIAEIEDEYTERVRREK